MPLSGDTVTYPKAVQEIKDYLLVHDKLKDSLDTYLPSPTPGSNLEKMKQFFMSDKLSFAFKKEHIDELFSTYTDANAIRIYFGLNSDGTIPEPTIIITACLVSQNGQGDIITAVNKTSTTSSVPAKQYPKSISPKSGYNQTNFDLADDTF
ncbi:hypothetical protein FRZ67_13245 [Panacibacter ginsenosidivorans]|uniref:Uncharacterized protein n=1 Tax=Panacibacter ginsenosidivorans TaxID=1813871 RepID=A0A5B8V9R7_9BACT|nr:hypothetical protein [Panacibacter ginsenosidivorans]QEC68217.1 hypothetical protein FRZ67_13245 [Panacibacter ginsenosidivorans]